MTLPKLALTAVFLLSICSPAWAETTGGKDSQASTAQNTNSLPESRLEDSKAPTTQPIKLNQNILLHCCSCTGSSNERIPMNLHTPFQSKKQSRNPAPNL